MTRVCISNLHTQTIITIESPRLLLRPGFPDDRFGLCDIFSEPETAWWADMPSFTDWCNVLDFIKWGNSTFDLDQYMITDKESDRLIGISKRSERRADSKWQLPYQNKFTNCLLEDLFQVWVFCEVKEGLRWWLKNSVLIKKTERNRYICNI